jgi:hypothetical protein
MGDEELSIGDLELDAVAALLAADAERRALDAARSEKRERHEALETVYTALAHSRLKIARDLQQARREESERLERLERLQRRAAAAGVGPWPATAAATAAATPTTP